MALTPITVSGTYKTPTSTAAQGKVTIVIPIVTQWYGMKEFAIADPDGYLITFAERVEQV